MWLKDWSQSVEDWSQSVEDGFLLLLSLNRCLFSTSATTLEDRCFAACVAVLRPFLSRCSLVMWFWSS